MVRPLNIKAKKKEKKSLNFILVQTARRSTGVMLCTT